MNVLQRKMFATGDVATNPFVDSYDEFQPYELDFNIEPKGEGYVAIQRNPRGEVVKETPINLALSAKRDPVEAFQVQTKNEGLRAVKEAGLGIAGLAGGRGALTYAGKKIAPYITQAVTSNRFLNPFTSVKKPGVAVPGKKGFQSLDPTKLSSFNVGIKPGAKYGFLGALGFGGLTAAQTTEEEVAEELKKLEEKSSTETQEKKDKVAPDPYMGGISDEEIDAVIGADTDAVTEAMAKADYDVEYAETVRDSITDFQDRYMDNKNMDRFLRNIGKSLVEEGRFTGIATGAVAAADEREAERILEAEREADISLASAKAGLKDKPSSKVITDYKIDLAASAADVEQSELTGQLLDQVEGIITTKDITGFSPILQSVYKKALGFAGVQSPLDPRERAIVLLEQIANGNIKTITGESGRTISNVDRQIAQKLIGDLKNPLTREDEILGNLRSQQINVSQRRNAAFSKYRVLAEFFQEQGLPVPVGIQGYDTSSIFGQKGSKVITLDMDGNKIS
jgi:hypothetical protein